MNILVYKYVTSAHVGLYLTHIIADNRTIALENASFYVGTYLPTTIHKSWYHSRTCSCQISRFNGVFVTGVGSLMNILR